MKAATTPEFIITFTHSSLIFDVDFSQNIEICVDTTILTPQSFNLT